VYKKTGYMSNFFWVDGQSIIDYKCFGGNMSFDTTFRTNNFEMSFAPILGTNHCKQKYFFGYAFMFNENISSFYLVI
jgi:hypothetical protein